MKIFFAILGLAAASFLPFGGAAAQTTPAASTTMSAPLVAPSEAALGHVHLLVTDAVASKAFWVTMGGTPITLGSGPTALEGVAFGKLRILLRQADHVEPAVGSEINHIGLYVPNVQQAVERWKAAGLTIDSGRNAQQAFVHAPGDLLRIEILEMPGQTEPVVFHHVHFYVHANDAGGTAEMQAWYIHMFGAVAGKRSGFDTGLVPGGELTFTKSDAPTATTAGHAVDHIGFNVKDLKAYCKKLEAAGVKLDTPYTERPELGLDVAFITDPWGVRIELNQVLTQSTQLR